MALWRIDLERTWLLTASFQGAVRDLPSLFFVCPGPRGWVRDVGSYQSSVLSAVIHELVDGTMTHSYGVVSSSEVKNTCKRQNIKCDQISTTLKPIDLWALVARLDPESPD